jgi:hypothetical protein
MMKNLFCFPLYLFPLIAIANIEQYYIRINKAEQFIIEDNFKQALDNYDWAFNEVSTSEIFIQDLYNASLCSLKCKNIVKAKHYMELMARKGCPVNFFHRSSYKKFSNIIQIDKGFSKKLNKSYKYFLQNQNKTVLTKYNKLISSYDSISKCCPNFSQKLLTVENNFIQDLELFIENFGFPSENIIGPTVNEDTTLAIPRINIIIYKYAMNIKQSTVNILLREIKNGQMHNMDSYFLRKRLGSMTLDSPFLIYKCSIYRNRLKTTPTFFEINNNIIGLKTPKEYENIMYYELTKNEAGFYFKSFSAKIGTFVDENAEHTTLSLYEKMPLSIKNCTDK